MWEMGGSGRFGNGSWRLTFGTSQNRLGWPITLFDQTFFIFWIIISAKYDWLQRFYYFNNNRTLRDGLGGFIIYTLQLHLARLSSFNPFDLFLFKRQKMHSYLKRKDITNNSIWTHLVPYQAVNLLPNPWPKHSHHTVMNGTPMIVSRSVSMCWE